MHPIKTVGRTTALSVAVLLSWSCVACWSAECHDDEYGNGDGDCTDNTRDELAFLRETADRIAIDARSLLSAASKSRWGVEYCMLKPESVPKGSIEDYNSLKELEYRVRERFDHALASREDIRFGFIAYSDYMVLVERPWETEDEREKWRATSGGDMFPGNPFSQLRLGETVQAQEYHYEETRGGFLLGVPIKKGGFAGALYFSFRAESSRE